MEPFFGGQASWMTLPWELPVSCVVWCLWFIPSGAGPGTSVEREQTGSTADSGTRVSGDRGGAVTSLF